MKTTQPPIALSAPLVAPLFENLNDINLAFPLPSEPTKLTTSFKRSSNGKKIIITAKLKADADGAIFQPVYIYFTRGRRGPSLLRALGRTNSRGTLSFKETSRVAPNVFYRACYLGKLSGDRLCSRAFELFNTK